MKKVLASGVPQGGWKLLGQEKPMKKKCQRDLGGAALREIGFRDLRHSFASLAIAAGMDPKALQRAMGHGSIRITLDVYAHLLPCSYDHATERMEALLVG